MLIYYEDFRHPSPYLVGIAVAQSRINGDLRTKVIYPIADGNEGYVEVEIAIGSEGLEVIKPSLAAWQPLTDIFGDNSEGYPYDDETYQDLYDVWDDGAARHFEAAQRLFAKYKPVIDSYADDAVKYMIDKAERDYNQSIQEAKDKGWDTTLIDQPKSKSFPYEP